VDTKSVDVVLDHLDSQRADGRDRRLRVRRATEARDARPPLAHRSDEDGAVRDRLVAGHGDVSDQRGDGFDSHEEGESRVGPARLRGSRDNPAMRIFSGIQPTGAKHLGNYAGGFRQYAETQEQGEAFFCIVDLHSVSVEYDPADLRERTLDLFAMLIATGLDPDRSTIFAQSHVTAHAESNWLLSSVTSFGQLGRMTQFKEKSESQGFVSAGLFTYPVLQAGDILLYQTDIVPVGIDQRQHIELTRDVAERFNSRYGKTFTLPRGVYPEVGAKIMDLQEPEKKMSTTGGTEQGTVYILDSPDEIRRKFKVAVTDSGREILHAEDKPGVSNLIEIMTVSTGESIAAIQDRYDGQGYGTFKTEVAESVISLLDPFQTRFREIRDDPGELHRLLAKGAEKAAEASRPTLDAMYERMGFVRLD
jgi:tryptophanyl-tRNA synthetase